MSLLAPLYVAGIAVLSLPILFHLIRRTPHGRRAFSSLMFLAPSPPRLTKRSRLDHLLLLFLRGLALTLVVLAFARPFFREASLLAISDPRTRRVAILVDTSASMQRDNLWQQAVAKAQDELANLDPLDDVGLYTFDQHLATVVELGGEAARQGQQKRALVRGQLAQLRPSWSQTDLGSALVGVADALGADQEANRSRAARQVVLISDLQRGAQTSALGAYQWPADIHVSVHQVRPRQTTNASVRLLADPEGSAPDAPRVRVTNAADSESGQFYLRWSADRAGETTTDAAAVYVPSGQSRVLAMPRPIPSQAADHLVLSGDHAPFDNIHYVARWQPRELTVAYLGDDAADDADGLLYYLSLALAGNPRSKVRVDALRADQPLLNGSGQRPQLVVVTRAMEPATVEQIKHYMNAGGTVLLVTIDQATAQTLFAFDAHVTVTPPDAETTSDSYVMLGEIDFAHPFFAAFAGPRYSDFTKIHFWKYRRVALGEESSARVVARFDNGDPALLEQSHGEGRLIVLTSGWHPQDSQLALSSKFVPLINACLDVAAGGPPPRQSVTVNEPVPLPAHDGKKATCIIRKPDGTPFIPQANASQFLDTDQPGIYQVEHSTAPYEFAVNIAGAESDTAPIDTEVLEQYGIRIGLHPTPTQEAKRTQRLRDTELEGRQKLWRWLVVLALCVLTGETWLAGKAARRQTVSLGESLP
jgi:hypothetical protein